MIHFGSNSVAILVQVWLGPSRVCERKRRHSWKMWPDDLSDLYLELRLILRRSNRTPRGGGGLSISELSRLLSRKGHDALRSAGATLRQFIAEEKVTFKDTNEKY